MCLILATREKNKNNGIANQELFEMMEDTFNYYFCASLLVTCNNRHSAHPVYE